MNKNKESAKTPKRRINVKMLAIIALLSIVVGVGVYVYAEDFFSITTKGSSWVQDENDANTYYMDTDGDDTYDITLKKNGNVWTYSVSVPDEKAEYYVLEEINRQGAYDLVGENGKKQPIALIEEGTGEVTLYNVAEGYGFPGFGNLELSKTVMDHRWFPMPDSTMFRFDITLTYNGTEKNIIPFLSGTQTYGNLSFTWSQENDSYTASASVYLKSEESVALKGIPAGVTYTITEVPKDGYDSYTGEVTGVILANETSYEGWENFLDYSWEPPVQTGKIQVKKTVLNDDGTAVSDDDNQFKFLAVFFGLKEKTDYTFAVYDANNEKVADKSFASLYDGSAETEFTLKNGQYAVFADLPVACNYQVLEYGAEGYTASYEIEGTELVASSRGENFEENTDLIVGGEDGSPPAVITICLLL